MQVIVERSCQIFPDDALPFPLSGPEIRLVGLQILHQLQTDILLQQRLRLLKLLLNKLSRLYNIHTLTSNDKLDILQLHVIVTYAVRWKVGIWILDLLLILILVHVSYIFQMWEISMVRINSKGMDVELGKMVA